MPLNRRTETLDAHQHRHRETAEEMAKPLLTTTGSKGGIPYQYVTRRAVPGQSAGSLARYVRTGVTRDWLNLTTLGQPGLNATVGRLFAILARLNALLVF